MKDDERTIVEELARQWDIVHGKVPADLLITNVNILDVYTETFLMNGSLLVDNGKILVVNPISEMKARETYNAKGMYALPGFMDAHFHFESSMITPAGLAELEPLTGTTTIFGETCDFTTAAGDDVVSAFRKLIKDKDKLPFNLYPFAPGKKVAVKYVKQLLDMPEIVGLGELNNALFLKGDKDEFKKIAHTRSLGKLFMGHAVYVNFPEEINLFAAYGASNEHETVSYQHTIECLNIGLSVQLRDIMGNLERNVPEIVKNNLPTENIMLCTDDISVADLKKGHMDVVIQKCIDMGIDPIKAIKMGSFNTARAYHMETKIGALGPGRLADIVFVKDYKKVDEVVDVMKSGKLIVKDGKLLVKVNISYKDLYTTRQPGLTGLSKDVFTLVTEYNTDHTKAEVKVLDMISLTSGVHEQWLDVKDGVIIPKLEDGRDLTRIIIVERYPKDKSKRVIWNGYVNGKRVTNGAISYIGKTTEGWFIATIGSNENDIYTSAMAVDKLTGGYAIVQDGKVLGTYNLPIYSMMTDASPDELLADFKTLVDDGEKIGYIKSYDIQWYEQMFYIFITLDRYSIL